MPTFSETLDKFKKVIDSCENQEQIEMGVKWCGMYIEKHYFYPNDNYELLLDFINFCIRHNGKTNV